MSVKHKYANYLVSIYDDIHKTPVSIYMSHIPTAYGMSIVAEINFCSVTIFDNDDVCETTHFLVAKSQIP